MKESICQYCNIKFSYEPKKKIPRKFCSPDCGFKYRRKFPKKYSGKNANNWKGGKHIHKGYVLVYCPNHPNTIQRFYVKEHRLVMEKHLGRYLKPEEVVHHINKNIKDNRIENLELFKNHSEHMLAYHRDQRKKQSILLSRQK